MFPNLNKFTRHRHLLVRRSVAPVIFLLLIAWPLFPAHAQGSFNSGSTGADGAFNPTTSQTVTLPASGIFNFTTVNIQSGVTITFTRNAQNTPVTILATGNVVINGVIDISGKQATSRFTGGIGGPGGFSGGHGAFGFNGVIEGANGEGPGGGRGGNFSDGSNGGGGGFATTGQGGNGGASYGSATLIPLIGGSGGGGGRAATGAGSVGYSGGGGGGAILIASSGSISGNGVIIANGGGRGNFPDFNCPGAGSGGAIRLVANTINGNISTQVYGSEPYFQCSNGSGAGYVRIEAYDLSGYNPNVNPPYAVFSVSTPKPAIPNNLPQLRITSVAGIAAPTNPVGTLNSPPDITLTTAQTNPVTVALAANNIPTGAIVQVKLTPEPGAATTVQSTPLAGTQASSTATASVTLPTAGVSLISATTTLDLTLMSHLKPIFIDGERVRKMEISATFGRESEITYITESGRRVRYGER